MLAYDPDDQEKDRLYRIYDEVVHLLEFASDKNVYEASDPQYDGANYEEIHLIEYFFHAVVPEEFSIFFRVWNGSYDRIFLVRHFSFNAFNNKTCTDRITNDQSSMSKINY